MISREDAEPLVGLRVSAKIGRDATVGILRAVTPTDRLIIAGERGHETLVELNDVSGIKEAQLECDLCHAKVNRRFVVETGVDGEAFACAECTRTWAAKQPRPSETCEDCGGQGAFYSPTGKAWRDAQCHARAGSLDGSSVTARVLTHESREAACRSDDIHSLRHQWRRTKSSYRCLLCYVAVYEKPAGYTR